MSRVVGRIVVGGDYRGNLEEIVKDLNALINSCEAVYLIEEGRIVYCESQIEGPSIYCLRHSYRMTNGTKLYADELTEEQLDELECSNEVLEEDYEDGSLELISARIARNMTHGKLIITAIGYDLKSEYGYFESMTIHCDGKVETLHQVADEKQLVCETERFLPTAVKAAA